MRLKDKVALVTGAASGMGESTARLFAREGAKVVVADLLEAEGGKIAADIRAGGGQAVFQRLDVSDEAGWAAAVGAAVSNYGRLDILINNAGLSGSDPDLFSTAIWDKLMDVNARGCFLGMRAAIPQMLKNDPDDDGGGRGSIVNVSSISGFVGQKVVHMAYNASKGAVRIMTKSAAVQFAAEGVRVNSVHPGVMPPMRSSKLTADPAIRQRLIRAIPMGRAGRIEEVAKASLFLASDDASYVTGTELVVDGGFLAM
ncbi:MAG: glucose 1-dehydrogenase [Rhodospirillales bacterium]|nr:MAG: glucose 1-dehydrogenase [Rhodospirillales bacterium]